MLYSNINISKLYENSTSSGMVEAKLFAFPIDDATKAQLESFITKGSGTWKSTTPLNSMGSDGSIGLTGSVNGKPAYLWINVSKTRSGQQQLELEDRSYLILDTTPENLKSLLIGIEGIDNKKRVYVKNQEGKELSLELWHDIKKSEPIETSQDQSDVKVDLDIAQEYPGAAPISGTVAEQMLTYPLPNLVSDQTGGLGRQYPKIDLTKNFPNTVKTNTTKQDKLNDNQKAILKLLGEASKNNILELSDGTVAVYAKMPNKFNAVFYNNDIIKITDKSKTNGSTVSGKYNKSGKIIIGGKEYTDKNMWNLLKRLSPSSKSASSSTSYPPTGFDQAAGNAFRVWANSTDELKKKYGKASQYDLDAAGKPDNSYIRKAYAAAKEEYAKYLETKGKEAPKVESKFKEGDVVYYRLIGKDGLLNKDTNIESKESNSKPAMSARELAYAKSNESIVTKFEDYLSITEDTEKESSEVDAQMSLIKDIKAGRVKRGIIRKIISSDELKVEDLDTERLETVKVSDILNSDKVKAAKSKVSIQEPEEKSDETKGEAAKSKFKSEKDETKSLKQELKQAKKEKKETKKDLKSEKKFAKKSDRQEKKQEKLKKKIEKVEGKTDKLGESVVYNFEDFMKMIKDLN